MGAHVLFTNPVSSRQRDKKEVEDDEGDDEDDVDNGDAIILLPCRRMNLLTMIGITSSLEQGV